MSPVRPPISEVFKAGTLFDYATWTNDSVITMANVPWNASYDDVIRPDLAEARANEYLNAQAATNVTLDNMAYARFDRPIRISTPFNIANQYNYIRVSNPIQAAENPDIQRDYFYFIMSVGYVNPGTTEITVQLDAWTTFGKHFTVSQAYIERGHVGIANENSFDAFGREYLTVPEGRDFGGEYQVADSVRLKVMDNTIGTEGLTLPGIPLIAPGYDVLICSTADLSADPGTVENPIMTTSQGGQIQGLMSGATFYVFDGASRFANYLYNNKDKPWITQCIVSVTLIPRVKRYIPGFVYSDTDVEGNPGMSFAPAFAFPTLTHKLAVNWREAFKANIPLRYRHLEKFLTYPYCVIEMTTWNATPMILKPEMWADADATITESVSIVPPAQRIAFSPQRYNAKPGSVIETKYSDGVAEAVGLPFPTDLGDGDDGGEWLDVMTMISNFPTMPIVNNSAIAYLANNKNSIAYQNNSADWAQNRAGQAIRAGVDNVNTGIGASRSAGEVQRGLSSQLTNNAIDAANQSMIAGAVAGIATGTAGGAVGGPVGMVVGAGMSTAGAIASGVQTAIQTGNMSKQTAASNSAGWKSQEIGVGASQAISQTNAGLAMRAAQGDYLNTIEGINAKVQDARLTQPTTVGQMGGEPFNLVMDNVEIALRFKLIDPAAIRSIGDFWLRYGYAVQMWSPVPANLMAMSKFTFWKMQEVYLSAGNFPEFYKQTIRGIMTKGMTVWDYPQDIGVIDIADNTALAGISVGYNV